jgi:hypothetical protein
VNRRTLTPPPPPPAHACWGVSACYFVELRADRPETLLIPAGMLHMVITLEDSALVCIEYSSAAPSELRASLGEKPKPTGRWVLNGQKGVGRWGAGAGRGGAGRVGGRAHPSAWGAALPSSG